MTLIPRKITAPASRRRPPAKRWNPQKCALFLEELYETCCVKQALSVVGMSMSGLYNHRATNAAFRARWDEALEAGYAMLEVEMLNRARNGHDEDVIGKDGTIIKLHKISNQLGLALLRMHGDHVAKIRAARDPMTSIDRAKVVRDNMAKMLDRMADNKAVRHRRAPEHG